MRNTEPKFPTHEELHDITCYLINHLKQKGLNSSYTEKKGTILLNVNWE